MEEEERVGSEAEAGLPRSGSGDISHMVTASPQGRPVCQGREIDWGAPSEAWPPWLLHHRFCACVCTSRPWDQKPECVCHTSTGRGLGVLCSDSICLSGVHFAGLGYVWELV